MRHRVDFCKLTFLWDRRDAFGMRGLQKNPMHPHRNHPPGIGLFLGHFFVFRVDGRSGDRREAELVLGAPGRKRGQGFMPRWLIPSATLFAWRCPATLHQSLAGPGPARQAACKKVTCQVTFCEFKDSTALSKMRKKCGDNGIMPARQAGGKPARCPLDRRWTSIWYAPNFSPRCGRESHPWLTRRCARRGC